MIRLRHKLLIHVLRLFDQSVAFLCLVFLSRASTGPGLHPQAGVFADSSGLSMIVAALSLLTGSTLFFSHFVTYDSNTFTGLGTQVSSVVKAVSATTVLLLSLTVVLGFPALNASDVLAFWAITSACLALSRVLVREALRVSRRSGLTSRQLLIVGTNLHAERLAAKFEACPELGYRIRGFISEHPQVGALGRGAPLPNWSVLGSLDDLQSVLERTVVDELLICVSFHDHLHAITEALRLGEQLGIVVRIIPDADQSTLLRRVQLERFEGNFVVTFFREQLVFQLLLKRVLDIVASAVLLVVLSPLLVAVALTIKIGSPGPVFYVQERVGMNRRRFRLFKFRSMAPDAELRRLEFAHLNEMDGPVFKIAQDPRVTAFGRVIRKTSIDELPQLLNVLMGQMSLVGPRPPLPSEVEQYDWLFQRRLSIKPGITCLWQVSGRNRLSFKQWMELDKEYVQNWSLWLDLKILARTIPVVLLGRGAS